MPDDRTVSAGEVDLNEEIFRHAPVGVTILHPDGTFYNANRSYLEMLGYTLAQIRGKSFRDIVHPDDLKKSETAHLELVNGTKAQIRIEVRSQSALGEWVWTKVNARLVRDGADSPLYFIAFVEEISEKKLIEERQRQHLNESNALQYATRVAMENENLVDAARILFEHCRILIGAASGYVAKIDSDNMGNTIIFAEDNALQCRIPSGTELKIRGIHKEAYRMGKAIFRNTPSADDIKGFFPDCEATPGSILVVPLGIQQDNVGLMAFAQKQSGFTSRDAQLAGAFADLVAIVIKRDLIQQQNDSLKSAMAQADRMSAIGRLAAGISHELNNPLSYAGYGIGAMLEDYDVISETARELEGILQTLPENARQKRNTLLQPSNLDKFKKRLDLASEGVGRIAEIAASLSKLSLFKKDEREPVQINAAVETAINLAMFEIKYRARLTRDFQETAPIHASPGLLAQCILNLIMNAVDAIEPGAVDSNEITLSTWQRDEMVCFQITDTGRGITPDIRDRLFSPFFTTRSDAGAGLGLSICRQIVTELGGDISINSTPHLGTTVTVHIPEMDLHRHAASTAGATEDSDEPPLSERILVIDDEEGVRIIMKQILEQHDIVEVPSGEEAIRLLSGGDRDFGLILCDLTMPRTSGIDVHRWLTEHIPDLAANVLFMSGGVFTDSTRDYLEEHQSEIIEKPFNRPAIEEIINKRITRRHDESRN